MFKIWPIFLLITFKSFACEVSLPDQFSLSSSTKEETFFSYSVSRTNSEIPYLRAFNCSKLAMSNKFLMIAFGPQNLEFSDRVGIYDFSNDYRNSGCFIKNSPFKRSNSFEERKKYLNEKWNYIKSCYRISVEDEGNQPLNMPRVQNGCQYTRTGSQKMSFNGGYCFVKPGFGSSYLIKFNLKEECKKSDSIKNLDIKVSDLEAMLNIYSSGDATGASIDLTAISSFPVRLTISPDEKVLTPSDDFGIMTPQFPGQYAIPDIHAGFPEAKIVGINRIQLNVPLWVDNSCKEKCTGNTCQSICDYAQPIVGNVEYYELHRDRKPEFLTSWYTGGVAQPKYQGEISGVSFEIPSELIKVGSTYRFKIGFNDPKYDFERFKNRIRSKLAELDQSIGNIGKTGINEVPEIVQVNQITTLPYINGIHGINFAQNMMNTVESAVSSLRNYLSFKLWPPYYESICSPENTSLCHGIKDNYIDISMDVKVIGMNEEENSFIFKVVKISRKSDLLESYEKTDPAFPEITCPF